LDLRRAEPRRPVVLVWLVAALAAVFVFLAICVGTDTSAILNLDDNVASWAYDTSASHPGFISFLDVVAAIFGNTGCAIALAVMAVYSLWRRAPRIAVWIATSGVVAIGGNALLKLVFRRERPFFDEPLHEIGGYSFPSGHAAGSAMFVTVAILMTIVLTGRGWRRRIIVTVLGLVGAGVGASRMFLGVHYLSDVVAGLCLGTAVALGLWILIVASGTRVPHELAVVTGSGRKRAAIILNPTKVGDVADFQARVTAVAERDGWSELLWFETTIDDPGHGQTLTALLQDIDMVVAAGGDGTVREVCEAAARTGIAVGILPLGTGNLLARNLSIPLNWRDALEVAFGGQDRAIDLATFTRDDEEDTVFLVMAGMGMDAAIMTGVNDSLKSRVGWFAYFVSGVKAARFPAMRVQIAVDDGEFQRFRARTVVVGNVGFLQAGIPLLPDAVIDDGTLDVVVIAPKRLLGWLAIIVRVVGRQRRTNDRLDRLTGHKVVVRAEKPMPMQLDGDPVGEGTEIVAQVHQGILLVRVPLT